MLGIDRKGTMIVGVTPVNLNDNILLRFIRMILDDKWASLYLLETALAAEIHCFSMLSVTGKQSTRLR
jgi:hypothetical protein